MYWIEHVLHCGGELFLGLLPYDNKLPTDHMLCICAGLIGIDRG